MFKSIINDYKHLTAHSLTGKSDRSSCVPASTSLHIVSVQYLRFSIANITSYMVPMQSLPYVLSHGNHYIIGDPIANIASWQHYIIYDPIATISYIIHHRIATVASHMIPCNHYKILITYMIHDPTATIIPSQSTHRTCKCHQQIS